MPPGREHTIRQSCPVKEPWASGWRQAQTPMVSAALLQRLTLPSVDHVWVLWEGQTRRASHQTLTKHSDTGSCSAGISQGWNRGRTGPPPFCTRTPCHLGMPKAPGLSCQWNLAGNPAEARRETGRRHLNIRLRAELFQAQPDSCWQDSFLSGCWPENSLGSLLCGPLHRTAHNQEAGFFQSK